MKSGRQTASNVRVLVAEDHPMTRKGICMAVQSLKGFEVLTEVASLDELKAALGTTRPDVVVLDIFLRSENTLEQIPQILLKHPETRVLIISGHDEAFFVAQAIKQGARGFVSKLALAHEFQQALQCVAKGQFYFPPVRGGQSGESPLSEERGSGGVVGKMDRLTLREMDVLRLIGDWKTTGEIAEILKVSPKTVEIHRMNLRHKLGFTNTMDLVRFAVEWRSGGQTTRQRR